MLEHISLQSTVAVSVRSNKGRGLSNTSPTEATYLPIRPIIVSTNLQSAQVKRKPTSPSHQRFFPQSQIPTSLPVPFRMPRERVKTVLHQFPKHLLPHCHCHRHPPSWPASTQPLDHRHRPASRHLLDHRQQVLKAPLRPSQSYLSNLR